MTTLVSLSKVEIAAAEMFGDMLADFPEKGTLSIVAVLLPSEGVRFLSRYSLCLGSTPHTVPMAS